jgi:hypothetical protein
MDDLPIDARLIAPETAYEVEAGHVRARETGDLHAACRARVAALVHAHVASGFGVTVGLLSRTAEVDDVATDVAVVPRGLDAATGGRHVETAAFLVTRSPSHLQRKAAGLAARGVRLVVAIDVAASEVLVWSCAATWRRLEHSVLLRDPSLLVPLPVISLCEDSYVDAAIADALIARRHDAIERARAEGRGQVLLAVLAQRGLHATVREREVITGERDADRLGRWTSRILTCKSVSDLLTA